MNWTWKGKNTRFLQIKRVLTFLDCRWKGKNTWFLQTENILICINDDGTMSEVGHNLHRRDPPIDKRSLLYELQYSNDIMPRNQVFRFHATTPRYTFSQSSSQYVKYIPTIAPPYAMLTHTPPLPRRQNHRNTLPPPL